MRFGKLQTLGSTVVTMNFDFHDRLERVYSRHPLSAESILQRLRHERGGLDGLRARDLAESASGGPTDQNHPGGAAADRGLAKNAGVNRASNVLDIGCGLGGTVRLLAEDFGCRCHGVELTATRFHGAVWLTRLVGLNDRVTFSRGDFMTIDVPGGPFDLAIAQSALMHFGDMPSTLLTIAAVLTDPGTLAVEEGVLLRLPHNAAEQQSLEALLQCWNGRFQSLEAWTKMLADAGFEVTGIDDLTTTAITDLQAMAVQIGENKLADVSKDEREGIEVALRLFRSGLLGMTRIIAVIDRQGHRPAFQGQAPEIG